MAQNPSAWSTYLPWVEYAHNSLILVSTELSPFMASLGYQPPLFEVQEDKVGVPSVEANMCCCRRVWRQVRAALPVLSSKGQSALDSSPCYQLSCGWRAPPTQSGASCLSADEDEGYSS